MCTIAIGTRIFEDVPIVFAANREERYDRPAIDPGWIEPAPRIFAPMDLEAGGTWLGVNEHALLVAIANRAGGPPPERSRGWLVRDLLRCPTVDTARERLEGLLSSRRYAGFTLLLADLTSAVVVVWDGAADNRALPPGIHVIVNEGMNDAVAKASTVRARLQAPRVDSPEAWTDRAATVLRDHGLEVCSHGSLAGTRSSSLIRCGVAGGLYWAYAEGSPCEYPHRVVLDERSGVHGGSFGVAENS